ncbi:MAG: ribose 1,5-bisphosphate isomerase [Candidatus Methanomethylophilaceae archaeon]|nr:ribose 1,5-bisphosphate isomerase [Candidatus Methanomethylophilaceae archaeon]
MTDTVAATAAKITDMTIRGAGRIARAGAEAMLGFATEYQGNDLEAFKKEVRRACDTLVASRPTAVSLWNGVHATVRGLDEAETVDRAREIIVKNAEEFVRRSNEAVSVIASIGAKRISDGDTIMTHCNSSVAIGVITEAHRQCKDVKVYATESRPWRQGLLTVRDLDDAGVDTTLIIDSAVRSVMAKVDKVFVGADTITAHGAVINKIGTSQLALAANEARVPFYVCSETYKFSPMTIYGDMVAIEERDMSEVVKAGEIPERVKVFNPVFDATPAKYIDAIITEVGMIHPAAVYSILSKQLGDSVLKEE